jgi:hypothetical protein
MRAQGAPVAVFAAKPHGAARLEGTLAADKA